MQGVLSLPESLAPVGEAVASALVRVADRFDDHLASDLPPVAQLVRHVERYRGKMLRPTLVMLSALAASPRAGSAPFAEILSDEHVVVGAVCEMVHMATLVHDDVLDEADVRRRGETVNRLHGNEAAVILGDYLIASAYHLCSTLPTRRAALAVGRASMVMCAGELLQLHHRDDFSLDEPTYFEIVDRKTAELIATAAELGAHHAGASDDTARLLSTFGRKLGVAFQIQDDLLDLTGDESVVGKSVGKDLEKGKMTLPMIHHLDHRDAMARGHTLTLLEAACSSRPGSKDAARALARELAQSGSIAYAHEAARRLVAEAKALLAGLPATPARSVLELMADAVVERRF